MGNDTIRQVLGDEANYLLNHQCKSIPKHMLQFPGSNYVDRVVSATDRGVRVLVNLQRLFSHGRLANTGYVSILPVDQGVEHSAGASFAPNPIYFDPENIVKLAVEGGCNAVASTLGVLGALARKYAHKIPFILKINHNELLSAPNSYDQIMFADVEQAYNLGACGVGATIYFGSSQSRRQIQEVSAAFKYAHELGMFTVLWAYLRNDAFKIKDKDFHTATDLTGQANYLGVTIEADLVKQKQPQINNGYEAVNSILGKYGKTHTRMDGLVSSHPIDMARYQVANCFMGRVGLINSGGASGKNDTTQAVRSAVINKRAGGMGLIMGRKAFQKPMEEGLKIIKSVQDVYLDRSITIA